MTVTQLVLGAIAILLSLAGALGIAWAVFRSASVEKLREIDKQLLGSQDMLIHQQEAEIARIKAERDKYENYAAMARADLTQKAAVDHLLEIVVAEEKRRADEHEHQVEIQEIHTMLLKDIIAQLKGARGQLG